MISVCVFAHNEERHIARCLASLPRAVGDSPLAIRVIANGCSDRTVEIARTTGRDDVVVVDLAVGDKANAWNTYVHDHAPRAAQHVFIDGDCRAEPGAIAALVDALAADPGANAAAAVPCAGRGAKRARARMQADRALAGNLYALRGEFVERVRQRGLRIPVGTVGEDSVVGLFAKIDLDSSGRWRDDRVVVSDRAGFAFTPLRPWSAADLRVLVGRLRRYSLRQIQIQALRTIWKRDGLQAWPEDVRDLYPLILDGRLPFRLKGRDALSAPMAMREMVRVAASRRSGGAAGTGLGTDHGGKRSAPDLGGAPRRP